MSRGDVDVEAASKTIGRSVHIRVRKQHLELGLELGSGIQAPGQGQGVKGRQQQGQGWSLCRSMEMMVTILMAVMMVMSPCAVCPPPCGGPVRVYREGKTQPCHHWITGSLNHWTTGPDH